MLRKIPLALMLLFCSMSLMTFSGCDVDEGPIEEAVEEVD